MAQLRQMDDDQRETFIAHIKQYRTYVVNAWICSLESTRMEMHFWQKKNIVFAGI